MGEFEKITTVLVSIAIVLTIISFNLPLKTAGFDFSEQGKIKRFASAEEMKGFLESSSEGYYGGGELLTRSVGAVATSDKSGMQEEAPAAVDYSRTNIQVEGVDEADIVKNDGKYIYAVSGNKVVIIDAYPAESARVVSEINFSNYVSEIFVSGDRLVVFSQGYRQIPRQESGAEKVAYYPYRSSELTFAGVYDITDRENPVLARNMTVDGNYYDSRMVGDYVYAIVNKNVYLYEGIVDMPAITANGLVKEVPATDIYYFPVPDSSHQFTTIVSINILNDNEAPSDKTILTGYTQNMYVSESNVYIVYNKRVPYYYMQELIVGRVLIPALPANIQGEMNSIKNSNMSYYEKMSAMGMKLQEYFNSLSKDEQDALAKKIGDAYNEAMADIQKEMEKTVVHKISISNGNIEYKDSGEVPGYTLNQFSMDEYNGYFRVATTTQGYFGGFSGTVPLASGGQVMTTKEAQASGITGGAVQSSEPMDKNHIYVLDSSMNIVGKLEDLAPGERIYSARFIGERAYLVTFKKTDPLFVIDISSPTNPKVLGELKITGYSDYLHPYDENHIIGIGKEAAEAEQGNFAWYQGVKISLFDVSDVSNPIEVSKFNIGDRGTNSYALQEHKAFLFSRDKSLLVLPIELAEIDRSKYPEDVPPYAYGNYVWNGAYVFELTLDKGFVLKGRITHTNETGGVYGYRGYGFSVKRSLYIGNVLYTVSDSMIKANDLGTLAELKAVALPEESMYPEYDIEIQ